MRLTIARTIQYDHREIRELAKMGARRYDHARVEIHVKGRPAAIRWRLEYVVPVGVMQPAERERFLDVAADPAEGSRRYITSTYSRRAAQSALARVERQYGVKLEHTIERLERFQGGVSGYAYLRIPDIARVARGTEYLITMKMPHSPEQDEGFPRLWQYPGLSTAPYQVYCSWQERFVEVVAHELRHIDQFRRGKPLSEIDAERSAQAALRAIRLERAPRDPRFGSLDYVDRLKADLIAQAERGDLVWVERGEEE